MDQINQGISAASSGLGTIISRSETDFIGLGRSLQTIHNGISELTNLMDGSARLIQGDDGNLFTHIKELVTTAIENLERLHQAIGDNMAIFPEALGLLGELAKDQDDINRSLKYIKIIAFNFVVETSRSIHQNKNLLILADEIKDLSVRMFNVSDQIKTDMDKAALDLSGTDDIGLKGANEIYALTGHARNAVQKAVDKIQALSRLSYSTIETIKDASQAVNSQVGNIIVSMQLQDNISQRVDHIRQGLSDIQTLIQTDEAIGERVFSQEERTGFAHSILLLQISQLEQIIAEVDSSYGDNFTAFTQIEDQIIGLVKAIEKTEIPGHHAGLISELSTSLVELDTIRKQGLSILEQFKTTAGKSVQSAGCLSDHINAVRNMSEDAHIKALNAIIAAHKLNRNGRVFNVLAKELKDNTDELVQGIFRVEQILEKMSQSTAAMGGSADITMEKSGDQTADDIGNTISKIQDVYQTMEMNLGDAMAQGKALGSSIQELKGELTFFREMSHAFTASMDELRALKVFFEDRSAPLDLSLFGDSYLLDRYTMDKERQIHQQSLAQEDILFGDLSNDPLGDNIELF